jgi:hypothetical protein
MMNRAACASSGPYGHELAVTGDRGGTAWLPTATESYQAARKNVNSLSPDRLAISKGCRHSELAGSEIRLDQQLAPLNIRG